MPIKGIDYHPHRLVIKRGDTVQWRWLDPDTSHTVTSRGGQSFKSSPAMKTGSYRVTFTRPGTYHYACKFHFTMKAEVVVQ